MTNVYLGLGSNLQHPKNQLLTAIQSIADHPCIHLVKSSSLYSSDSILEGQPRYINAVIHITTTLTPIQLLDTLQTIEQSHGRERKEHWGARTLDLDILLFGNQIINEPRLTIPHPQIEFRSFVLIPLLELTEDIQLPDGRAIKALATHCASLNLIKI